MAAVFSGGDKPAPPRLADTGAPATAPPAVAVPPPAVAEVAAPPPEQPKKRGFWGRLFGRRDKAEEKSEPKGGTR
ncbi:hypothetical protein D3C83_176400 [compost metagenome]